MQITLGGVSVSDSFSRSSIWDWVVVPDCTYRRFNSSAELSRELSGVEDALCANNPE